MTVEKIETVEKLEIRGTRKPAKSPLWAAVQGVHLSGHPDKWPLLPVEPVCSPCPPNAMGREKEPGAMEGGRLEDERGFAQFIGCLKGQVRINGDLLSTGVEWDATS